MKSSGVAAFLRRHNGNRSTCAKAIRFMPPSIACNGDMELFAALQEEFAPELDAMREQARRRREES